VPPTVSVAVNANIQVDEALGVKTGVLGRSTCIFAVKWQF
jgi:hypothetical protein